VTRNVTVKLPSLLARKIYKTGQTRGADDDEIYQNRVSRSSTVLIPYPVWISHFTVPQTEHIFAKGYIVLISPALYFVDPEAGDHLAKEGLILGENALVFYETRLQWLANNPDALGWHPAESRLTPLNGQYVARISATTALDEGERIVRGFETSANKGAGIRVYEYADDETIARCRTQLEALFWLCDDAFPVVTAHGMTPEQAAERKALVLSEAGERGLLDIVRLQSARILGTRGSPICPLCLEELSAAGFFSRMEQAKGREVLDLTVTQVNLFHVEELRMGMFNHQPYNVGWGHHHCNVVVKDSGIKATLAWMRAVLDRNVSAGYMPLEQG
jgi:hypothetical protein